MRVTPCLRPPLALLATLGLAATSLLAQRGAQSARPVFRSTTELVLVDAIVTDRNDRVVSDLTRDDFVVTVGGRAQPIAEFSFESIPLADRPIDLSAPTRPPSDVAANAQVSRQSRAFVFVIDDQRIPTRELVPLARMMTDLLKTLTPDDQVAVIYAGRSDLSYDFTNDINRMIDVVNRRREALGMTLPGSARSLMMTLRNVVRTLGASRQARRAVFLVGPTGCIPHPPNPNWEECLDLVKEARKADVPFYVLDPRLFINGDVVSAGQPGDQAAMVAAESAQRDEMMTLASATGGRAMSGAGNPSQAAVDIIAENGSYYLIGFYPDPSVSDGKYHEIDVTVKRPGLRIRGRRGYVAPTTVVKSSTPTRDMTATLGAGLDDPGLPIRAFAAPIAPGPKGRIRTLVTVEVTYPRETAERALNEDLRVGILALTPDAKIKASFQRPFQLTGTWLSAETGVLVINETIDLPPQRLALRVGVTSRALAKSGTTHLYVEPSAFGDKDLTMSGLILGESDVAADAVMGIGSLERLVPFQPSTRRTLVQWETVRLFARLYWKRNAERADVTVQVVGGEGRPPVSSTVIGHSRADGGREGALDTTVPLSGLPRGAYVLRVDATLPGSKPVTRQVPFDVR
jgi:VWFA-related protein